MATETLDKKTGVKGTNEVKKTEKKNLVGYLLTSLDRGLNNDQLTVSYLYGKLYRVNWYKVVTSRDSMIETHKMRKSQLIRAEEEGGDVVTTVIRSNEY